MNGVPAIPARASPFSSTTRLIRISSRPPSSSRSSASDERKVRTGCSLPKTTIVPSSFTSRRTTTLVGVDPAFGPQRSVSSARAASVATTTARNAITKRIPREYDRRASI